MIRSYSFLNRNKNFALKIKNWQWEFENVDLHQFVDLSFVTTECYLPEAKTSFLCSNFFAEAQSDIAYEKGKILLFFKFKNSYDVSGF